MRKQFPVAVSCLLAAGGAAAAEPDKATLAGRVQAVFKAHCHRCHGEDGVAEGGFNYVLDFAKLVDRKKVVPGRPDRSKVLRRMTSTDDPMPPAEEKDRPSAADLAQVKLWIAAGAPAAGPTAARRAWMSPEDMHCHMRADLEELSERDRPFTRYFTLVHLANAALSDDELQTYRHGLSKLVNSLSWGRHVVVPAPIDPGRTIFRIDMRDYRWEEPIWEAVQSANPYAVLAAGEAAQACAELTRCRQPHVRADWFVAAASRPPLYHRILQLPATEQELEQRLGVDVAADIRQERVIRAGFNGSGVSRNNRLIERHEAGHTVYWKSYDFASNTGAQNLFARPLGPATGDGHFRHDGGEIIFNLPNGLQGYLLADAAGRRIDKGPTAIVSDPRRPDRAVENGLSCMSCHARGLIEKADQVREHVLKNARAFSAEERDAVLALYAPRDKFLAVLREDARRFQEAVARTGAPLSATEPVAALALRFEAELDLPLAASEAGARPNDLLQALERSQPLAKELGALRVAGGTVQRQAFVECFANLVRELRRGEILASGNKAYAKSVLLGDRLRSAGDAAGAIAAYTEAISLAADSSLAYLGRGDARLERGDLDRALADYGEALRLDPRSAVALSNRGLVHQRKSDYVQAVADCTAALRLDPTLAAAYHNRAAAHFGQSKLTEAIADYTAALRLDPKSAVAFNNRGYAHLENGDLTRALADFDEALRLQPRFVAVYNNRGLAHSRKGDYDRAIADFTEAVRLDPKFAKAYFNRGVAFEKKGDSAKAQADRTKAAQLDPSLDHD